MSPAPSSPDHYSPAPKTPLARGPLFSYASPDSYLLDKLEKEEAAKGELVGPTISTSPSASRKRSKVVGVWHGRLKLAEQEISDPGVEEYEIEDWFDVVDDDEAEDGAESRDLTCQTLDNGVQEDETSGV